jgi:hypothetical protein
VSSSKRLSDTFRSAAITIASTAMQIHELAQKKLMHQCDMYSTRYKFPKKTKKDAAIHGAPV